jgi:2,5-diketo-D-gluconate reductase A
VREQRLIAEESVELASGTKIPILGLGTWQARGRSAVSAVLRALEVGYRHIDTATAYGNEEQVGQAVAESGVPREEIFVTTKLPPSRAGRERATLEDSLDALGFGYVDLWLIHWPPSGGAAGCMGAAARAAGGRARTRGRGEQLQRSAARRARAGDTPPAGGQPDRVEPCAVRLERARGAPPLWCAARGLQPAQDSDLRDPRLVPIAEAHGVTPAQVVLRWHIEHRIVAIPKSTNAERIAENAAIFSFELTPSEVEHLDRFAGTRPQ